MYSIIFNKFETDVVFSEERKKTIKELNLGAREVVTVQNNWQTIRALNHMNKSLKHPVVSAVPVVNQNGKIVGTFSGSNLRVSLSNPRSTIKLRLNEFLGIRSQSFLLLDAKCFRLCSLTTKKAIQCCSSK